MDLITGLLTAFPKELVIAIAGLALLGTIASGLATALRGEAHFTEMSYAEWKQITGVILDGAFLASRAALR
jgi:benzoate membrane transport protein